VTRSDYRNLRNGLLFASPFILGFGILYLYPFVMTIKYSLQDFNAIKPPVWIGFENYHRLLFEDERFWKSLWNTLYFTFLSVPLSLALALLLAMLLSMKVRGQAVFRTVFFLPTIVPLVASAVLWMWVLNPEGGLLNGMLRGTFGIEGPGWLASVTWAKPALVIMSLWGIGSAMVIFIAGLAEVPQSLYEVADIDGAGPVRKFWNVTMPMVTPIILFNLIIGLIGSLQYFTQVYVMTKGRGYPDDATLFYALYLYRESFYYLEMCYGSAMAWIMFLVILAATIAVVVSSKKWVHYHGE
jgi:multiple sugar transport system permease protein